MSKPTAHQLWKQSCDEHQAGSEAQQRRYFELLVQHGLLVKREPGDSNQLPCGYQMSNRRRTNEQ